jgi:hypothetical protein
MIWNRLEYRKDPATGKRVSRPNDSAGVVVRPVRERSAGTMAALDGVTAAPC